MISMVVVAFVTAAMITVLSAFSGIEELVKDLFSSFDAPFTLVPSQGKTIPDSLLTDQWFSEIEGLAYYTRVIEEDAWLNYSHYNLVATVKGVSSDYGKLAQFDSLMYIGAFKLTADTMPRAVVGLGVRSELMLPVDTVMPEQLEINAPIRGKRLSRYREQSFNRMFIPVTGVFSANSELDLKYVFVPLDFARELFGMPDDISCIELAPVATVDENIFLQRLQTIVPEGVKVKTRYDKNALIYRTNASEKWATFLILLFILVIASFNIIASLTMLIIEKRGDIKVLGSMGMTREMIQRIFIYEGLMINFLGAVGGTVLGLIVCFLQQKFGLVAMSGAVVDYYPVMIKPLDVAGIFVTVVAIGSLFCLLMVRLLLRQFAWNDKTP